MPPTVKPRRSRRPVLFLAALAPAGCGLANYEHEMQLADARLQRFDDENRLLGDPLILPGGDAVPAADVFLRPPRGSRKTPSTRKRRPLRYPTTGGACATGPVDRRQGRRQGQAGKADRRTSLSPAADLAARHRAAAERPDADSCSRRRISPPPTGRPPRDGRRRPGRRRFPHRPAQCGRRGRSRQDEPGDLRRLGRRLEGCAANTTGGKAR